MKKIVTTAIIAASLLPARAQEFQSGPITFTVINKDTKEIAVSRVHSVEFIETIKIEDKYVFNGEEYRVTSVNEGVLSGANAYNFIFDENIKTFEGNLIAGYNFGTIKLPSKAEVNYPVVRRANGEVLWIPGTLPSPEKVAFHCCIEHLFVGEGAETILPTFCVEEGGLLCRIRHLYIPSTIKYFSADVIRTVGVSELYFKSAVPPRTDGTVGLSQFDTMKLYVPEEAVDAYKSDRAWGKFKNILPMGYIPGYNEFGEGPDNAIGEIEADGEDYYIAPEYYTLQGLKVSHPEAGQIYIVRRGAKVTKEVF